MPVETLFSNVLPEIVTEVATPLVRRIAPSFDVFPMKVLSVMTTVAEASATKITPPWVEEEFDLNVLSSILIDALADGVRMTPPELPVVELFSKFDLLISIVIP